MKKVILKYVVPVLLTVLLCIGYFASSIRPAIAVMVANRYIQNHFQQYDCAPAKLVATGYQYFYGFERITDYGVQSLNSKYIAYVELDGWLPFIIEKSYLWERKEGEDILIAQ